MEPAGSPAVAELEQKQQTVLKLIKSLLNSAQGDLTIEQLERDYHQMVNEAIPYKQLHHATLASLLQSAPETVQLVNRSGKLYVRTPPGARDHIAALVAGQRPAASKKKRGNGMPMRRPVPRAFPRPALLPHPNVSPHPLPLMRPGPPPIRSPPQRWSQPPSPAPQAVRGKKPKHRGKKQSPPRLPVPRLPPAYTNFRPAGPVNGSFRPGSFRPGAPTRPNFRPPVPASNSLKPSFSKEHEGVVRELKQRLEKLVRELGYQSVVFRSVPLQNRWLATLEVNGKRYTSFPDERPTIEEAEAIVAQKALDDLQHLSKVPPCPETASLDTCIARVAELVRGELHGLWFSHLCELYTGRHAEKLPPDFCERACARETQRGDTGIAFIKHQNLWILNEKTPGGTDALKTAYGGSSSVEPRSLPHMAEQQMSLNQQPSSLPNLPLKQTPRSPARRTNSSPRPHEHPQASPSKAHSKSTLGRPSLSRAVTMPVQPVPQGKPPHSGAAAGRKSSGLSSASSTANATGTPQVQQQATLNKLNQLSLKNSYIVQNDSGHSPVDLHTRNEKEAKLPYINAKKIPDSASSSESAVRTVSSSTLTSIGYDDVSVSSTDTCSDSSNAGARINGVKDDTGRDGAVPAELSTAPAAAAAAQLPVLRLPEDDTWQVYVSHILDDSRICFRLMEDSYNSAYEELVTRMELHYFDKENCAVPPSVCLGHYYALRHHQTWFRVLVIGVTEASVSALFVDHGETEEVAKEDVFELAQQFMNLPCQSVTASLSELEGIRCAPLTSALHTKVLGQTFSASVISRSPGLKVVLYDTSASEKVNINDQLLQVVPESFTKPHLPQVGGIAEVFVTAVHDDGRVFVTVESETYTLLERMLAMAKVRAEELSGEAEVDLTKLYLARFSSDEDWHRVRPGTPSSKQHEGSVVCECVDWGVRELLPPHRLIDLSRLSPTLSLVPHQVSSCLKAMECSLANVPPVGRKWTRRASARLEELQPSTGPVLLKTVKVDPMTGVPEVLLFKRLLPQNELISINETLAIDSKLFSDSEENNNESLSSDGERTVTSLLPRPAPAAAAAAAAARPPATEGGSKEAGLPTPRVAPPRLPAVGDELDVYVTFAANPDNFAVQSVKEYNELEKLRREMQDHYSSSDSAAAGRVTVDELVVGGYYAALHTDKYWYRVQLNKVMSGADMVCGVFIDFGDCFVSPCYNVRKLLPNFAKLPHQSIKASLAGVVPRSGDWMPEDTCRFRDLVQDKEFVSFVLGTALDQALPNGDLSSASSASSRLVLKLVDTSHDDKDVYIDELLIEEDRALPAQPSKSSGGGLLSRKRL